MQTTQSPKAGERTQAAGFDNQKRWGNSAIKGLGVNSPAMMEARMHFARKAIAKAKGQAQ